MRPRILALAVALAFCRPALAEQTFQSLWQSPDFPFKITALAFGAFAGGDKPQTALADGESIYLYSYPPNDGKPLASFAAGQVLNLETAAGASGRALLLATIAGKKAPSTLVLTIDEKGRWSQMTEISGTVREYHDDSGSVLAVQEIFDDKSFPLGSIHPLEAAGASFRAGKPSIREKHVDWIYDFTKARLGGSSALIYRTSTGRLRVQFDHGFWKSAEEYGATPVRLNWAERAILFVPKILVLRGGQSSDVLLAVRNIPALEGAAPLGAFSGGELERLEWDGTALVATRKADLSGYVPSIALVGGDLVAAVVGKDKSAVMAFAPGEPKPRAETEKGAAKPWWQQ